MGSLSRRLGSGCAWLVIAAFAFAAPAGAATLVDPTGQPVTDAQAINDASLVPTTPATIVLHRDETCPGRPGRDCTLIRVRPLAIYISLGDSPLDDIQTRLEMMHELGHAYDATVLKRADRLRFTRLLGRSGPWWGWEGDGSPPVEQFAVAYSFCATGAPLGLLRQYSYFAYHPTVGGQARVCAALKRKA